MNAHYTMEMFSIKSQQFQITSRKTELQLLKDGIWICMNSEEKIGWGRYCPFVVCIYNTQYFSSSGNDSSQWPSEIHASYLYYKGTKTNILHQNPSNAIVIKNTIDKAIAFKTMPENLIKMKLFNILLSFRKSSRETVDCDYRTLSVLMLLPLLAVVGDAQGSLS